LIFSAPTNNHL